MQMADKLVKIVITGAESTGKSILSEALGNHFNSPWIPELARSYIENLGHHYTYSDVELIARLQIEKEQNIPKEVTLVFFDTWLIITKVWFEFVFGRSPEWLSDYISRSTIDLFLLCDIDIPWEADPVRENGGDTRKILQDIYKKELKDFGFTYELVTGSGIVRTQHAIKIVDDYLKLTNGK
jgi:nicotinamide riboside kinase